MRVFDELVANSDRNRTNMLIDLEWTLWLGDHLTSTERSALMARPDALVAHFESLGPGALFDRYRGK